MSITLHEALQIFPFSEAKLVAGKNGIDRLVESANIQEVPEVEKWLHGKEILFSAGYAFGGGAEEGCRLIRAVCERGAACLVLKPGQYLPSIPPEMIACANEYNFPLLELPSHIPYMDCMVPILERITQEQIYVLRRIENIHERLMQTIVRGEGLDGICTVLNRVISCPVFISTPTGTILAACVDQIDDVQYNSSVQDFFETYCTQNSIFRMKRNQCNTIFVGSGKQLICIPIFAQEEHIAYLIFDLLNQDANDMDLLVFEQASSLVAIEILQEQAIIQQEQRIREQFLEDLLNKRYNDERIMLRRGKYIGFDLNKKNCIFILDEDAFEKHINLLPKTMTEKEIQTVKRDILATIHTAMEQYPYKSLLLNSGVGVVGMCAIRNGAQDMQKCVKILNQLITDLKKKYPYLSFSAGIGGIQQGVSQIEPGWQEAKLALRAERALNKPGNRSRVSRFDELGCLCFLSENAGSAAMREFYDRNIHVLLEYDQTNHAELIHTLKTYYNCGCNICRTAEQLYVHKNSVVYRLKKVESLIGKSLSDYQTSFDLQLCLKLTNIV